MQKRPSILKQGYRAVDSVVNYSESLYPWASCVDFIAEACSLNNRRQISYNVLLYLSHLCQSLKYIFAISRINSWIRFLQFTTSVVLTVHHFHISQLQ